MTDQRPFEDIQPVEDGFSIPEEKWRELLFIGALRREGEAFVRDPARPFPPFRTPNLFPLGARFFPSAEAGRVRLRVERPSGMPLAEGSFLAGRRLARRLEAAEAAWAFALAAALARHDPVAEVAREEAAGGVAVCLGSHSPLTRALGLGMEKSLSLLDLEALEVFFRSRGCPPRIAACPFADPSVLGLTSAWGYSVEGFESVLFRPLGPGDRFFAETAGARVEVVEEGQRDLWTRTLLTALGEGVAADAAYRLALALFEVASDALLARHRGEVAGVGALFRNQRLALAFADATLPGIRRRGVQGALIEARLAQAVAAGCDLAMAVTEPGSAVQRNHERAGFRLAYTRAILSRALG
jgi:hypothetical protein